MLRALYNHFAQQQIFVQKIKETKYVPIWSNGYSLLPEKMVWSSGGLKWKEQLTKTIFECYKSMPCKCDRTSLCLQWQQ